MTSTSPSMASATAMSGMMDSGNMEGMSAMSMSFNSDNLRTMLFSTAWVPTTTSAYVGTWFFLFALAIIWRGLVLALSNLDRYFVRKHEGSIILIDGGKQQATQAQTVGAWRVSVNLPRAALATLNQGIAYLLMIAVMTMNIGFFFAVLVGYFMGEVVFGRVRGVASSF